MDGLAHMAGTYSLPQPLPSIPSRLLSNFFHTGRVRVSESKSDARPAQSTEITHTPECVPACVSSDYETFLKIRLCQNWSCIQVGFQPFKGLQLWFPPFLQLDGHPCFEALEHFQEWTRDLTEPANETSVVSGHAQEGG